MIKISEIPVILYLSFMIVYFSAGDRDSPVWSGLFFFVMYIAMCASALQYKHRVVKNVMFSIPFVCFWYSVLKYIFGIDLERWFVSILLLLCIFGFYKLQNRK